MAQYIITNQPEPINFEIGDDFIARTVQNAKNLLMTHMGEVPYDRLRGFDPALYHLPIDQMRLALMPELDRVMLWEPDVDVLEAAVEMMDNNQVLIKATIEIEAED